MSSVSGMAASIRAATESETFDLAGQTTTTITNTVKSAFSDPLPLQEMIRITFVTGAGKLARQKYDDGAAKAVTSTLRDIGFEEDRGASCVIECAGCFKQQHDTGKNLKTVVVFPHIIGESGGGSVEDGVHGLSLEDAKEAMLVPEGSPEYMIAMSSSSVFEKMVTSKCPAWSQKKGCVSAIGSLKKIMDDCDKKLLSGTPLSDAEQNFYDSVTMSTLDEKESTVKKAMQSQVEAGKLTKLELDTLLAQNKDRINNLSKDIEESQSKPNRVEKLKNMKEKALQRKELLEKITPTAPPRLRHEAEITKLRTEMVPLKKLSDESKGRLLSIKETQTLARMTEIEEQIAQLEEGSRGWFEDDDAFNARLKTSRQAFESKQKMKKKAAPKTTANTGFKYPSVNKTKFVTPGAKKSGAWGKPAAKKKPTGGGLFAAMMDDSDSD